MSWVRLGKILGVVAAVVVVFIITISDSPLRAPVIAVAALAVLVAAGNWLNDWFGIKRKSPEFGSEKDFQLIQALNQLKGKPVQVSKTQTERKEETKEE